MGLHAIHLHLLRRVVNPPRRPLSGLPWPHFVVPSSVLCVGRHQHEEWCWWWMKRHKAKHAARIGYQWKAHRRAFFSPLRKAMDERTDLVVGLCGWKGSPIKNFISERECFRIWARRVHGNETRLNESEKDSFLCPSECCPTNAHDEMLWPRWNVLLTGQGMTCTAEWWVLLYLHFIMELLVGRKTGK